MQNQRSADLTIRKVLAHVHGGWGGEIEMPKPKFDV